MPDDRRLHILGLLLGGGTATLETPKLCEVCAEVTKMTGAGLMLMSSDIPSGSVCCSDTTSELIERLQFALGEGPCVDAHRFERPVLEPDLVSPKAVRWPAFSGPVIDAGARAVFGFPLRVGAARLGAMNLYRDAPGPLTVDQHANALVMADVAAHAILVIQAHAPAGTLATALEEVADFNDTVHQASGMVAAQLGIPIAQALIRLRSFAFGNERALAEVAGAVVARTLRLVRDETDAKPDAGSGGVPGS